jgi:hypothetical protein
MVKNGGKLLDNYGIYTGINNGKTFSYHGKMAEKAKMVQKCGKMFQNGGK